jgi:hypothetical protein
MALIVVKLVNRLDNDVTNSRSLVYTTAHLASYIEVSGNQQLQTIETGHRGAEVECTDHDMRSPISIIIRLQKRMMFCRKILFKYLIDRLHGKCQDDRIKTAKERVRLRLPSVIYVVASHRLTS